MVNWLLAAVVLVLDGHDFLSLMLTVNDLVTIMACLMLSFGCFSCLVMLMHDGQAIMA